MIQLLARGRSLICSSLSFSIFRPCCLVLFSLRDRFYWSINLGALIAYLGVAYICQEGAGDALGGERWGFFVGYTIPAIAMGTLLSDLMTGYTILAVAMGMLDSDVEVCSSWVNGT